MCPSLIEIGSKTAEKNSAQTNKQTDIHYENNVHFAVNQNVYYTTSTTVLYTCTYMGVSKSALLLCWRRPAADPHETELARVNQKHVLNISTSYIYIRSRYHPTEWQWRI